MTRPGCIVTAGGKATILVDADLFSASLAVNLLAASEIRTLALAADGLGRRQIAEVLGVTPECVAGRMYKACRKLGVRNKEMAVLTLLREGVLE